MTTDKDKSQTGVKVAKWLRDKGKFPKLSQKLEGVENDDDDDGLVVEIPIPSCPFGVILRLKPVFNVNFGIYGDVEATWWTSCSRTITDVVDGEKVVDDTKNLSTPDNKFAFNAFGSFHVGGGGELFVGLGKKLGKKAAGIGAFLRLTIDFDLNITPVTVGDYTLGSADEFCSITGNGKFGGKILTGGLFGDISFLVKDFKWWDGVVWTYNPRIQFDNKFITVPDEDSKGPYTKQTMSYKFTELGLNSVVSWTKYHKPVLCVYESDNQALDKPTEVLYDRSFGKEIKKNTRYEFVYKNREGNPIYVIPGVEGPGGEDDITLYTPYKTTVQSSIKPNIQYHLSYDDDTKSYDYVYQALEVDVDDVTNEIKYTWALPFTLRNATAIPDYWEDWGVYTCIYDDDGPYKTRYTTLKNRIYYSGKYMIETSFKDEYNKDFSVESGIYYVPKGQTTRYKINDYDAREYSYQVYKVVKKDPGDILLKFKHLLDKEIGLGYPLDYKKMTNNMY